MEETIAPLRLDDLSGHYDGFHFRAIPWIVSVIMLLALPLAGVIILSDQPATAYLQLPPMTRHVTPAGFSYRVFGIFTALDLILIGMILFLLSKATGPSRPISSAVAYRFPLWGWMGVLLLMAGWMLAWSRFDWFSTFQNHTFCLPWIGYIILINALCIWRSGHSILTAAPWRFVLLIPGSALFWWFFEYLNRFVENWYYVGVSQFNRAEYAAFASLAFATVLPAVMSTQQLLLTFQSFSRCADTLSIPAPRHPRVMAAAALILSASGLFLLGVIPNQLFALVWFAPLLLILSMQVLLNQKTFLSSVFRGDWGLILSSAIAALICGFLWELWNVGSLARWHYTVPYVDRFHLFAMPMAGYGGYLPFGLECLLVGGFILNIPILRKRVTGHP